MKGAVFAGKMLPTTRIGIAGVLSIAFPGFFF